MFPRAEFQDRADAGRRLGRAVAALLHGEREPKPVVLGLPRGGVVVAAEVARALNAALDVVVVRKMGAPFQPELAIGAVVDIDGRAEVVLNDDIIQSLAIDGTYLRAEAQARHQECVERLRAYRGERAPRVLSNRVVVVVDDGIATGATVRAALQALRRAGALRLVLAVPVAPQDTLDSLRGEVDDIVCLSSPPMFSSVGRAYERFDQTTDAEVLELLNAAQARDA